MLRLHARKGYILEKFRADLVHVEIDKFDWLFNQGGLEHFSLVRYVPTRSCQNVLWLNASSVPAGQPLQSKVRQVQR